MLSATIHVERRVALLARKSLLPQAERPFIYQCRILSSTTDSVANINSAVTTEDIVQNGLHDTILGKQGTEHAVGIPKKFLLKDQIDIYSALSKVRLSSLVVMTTGAGFFMAGGPISWTSCAAVCIGTSLAAASANTFNQVIEVDLDKKMKRTCKRPLPAGKISRNHALAYGTTTAAVSTAILAAGCNPLVAGLGAFNIGLYSLVYTPLKTRSEWNTWVGSLVGAIPPVMGWAAATGSAIAPEAAIQAALLFAWQMPHFFALSWRSREDYMRGGYKMVACADPTGSRSAALALRYSLYMVPLPIIASICDATSVMFAVEGTVVNAYAVYLAHKFYQKPSNATAQRVFLCSLWYLPVMLGCMVLHSQHWLDEEERQKSKGMKIDNGIKKTWKEAFLGEVENFQSKTNSSKLNSVNMADLPMDKTEITDESPLSLHLQRTVRLVREKLKDLCIHESLWGKDEQDTSYVNSKADESSILCPVHVGKTAKETIDMVSKRT